MTLKWMEIAWAQVGVTETAGPAATPEIIRFFENAGRPDITSDETPWCAAFVNACLAMSNISLAAVPLNERLLARSCLKHGTPITDMRVGAIGVIKRGTEAWQAHVFFITGWTATHVMGLGGNQSNSVSVQAFPIGDLIGMCWPVAAQSPGELAANGSRTAAAAARQQRDGAKTLGSNGAEQMVPAPDPSHLDTLSQLKSASDKASSFKGVFETLELFATFAWGKLPLIIAGVTIFWLGRMAWDAYKIGQFRAEDHNEGFNPVAPTSAGATQGGVDVRLF